MKRKNIFIASAFVLALGSAFTTKPSSKPLINTNGYARTLCNTVVVVCNDPGSFTCLTSTNAQAYRDIGTCQVALTKITK